MIRIILNGALGKMGRMVTDMAAFEDEMEIVAGVDRFAAGAGTSFPLFESLGETLPQADVLIDFSRPDALEDILTFCRLRGIAAVLATTGYQKDDLAAIRRASETLSLFRSANMSMGINVLMDLTREAAATLKGFDIEIVEMHHNTKVDAPSGTALMLADGINEELMGERQYIYGRHTKTNRRQETEIGIHSIRGGTLTGEHHVHYIGQDESVVLSHSAQSRRIYAVGALRAARFISKRSEGLYNMQDLLLEQSSVTSLLVDKEQALMTVWNVQAHTGTIAHVFSRLGEEGVLVDMISQTPPRRGAVDISFTLRRADVEKAKRILDEPTLEEGVPVTKLTIEGRGMERQSGVAAKVLERLALFDIPLLMITTSETKISFLVAEEDEKKAVQSLREAFEFS